MSNKILITEKPSVAREFAKVLGINGANITVNAGKGDDTIHAYYYYFGSNNSY